MKSRFIYSLLLLLAFIVIGSTSCNSEGVSTEKSDAAEAKAIPVMDSSDAATAMLTVDGNVGYTIVANAAATKTQVSNSPVAHVIYVGWSSRLAEVGTVSQINENSRTDKAGVHRRARDGIMWS